MDFSGTVKKSKTEEWGTVGYEVILAIWGTIGSVVLRGSKPVTPDRTTCFGNISCVQLFTCLHFTWSMNFVMNLLIWPVNVIQHSFYNYLYFWSMGSETGRRLQKTQEKEISSDLRGCGKCKLHLKGRDMEMRVFPTREMLECSVLLVWHYTPPFYWHNNCWIQTTSLNPIC